MARKNASLLNLLVRVPWWISIALAVLVLIVSKLIIPNIAFDNQYIGAFIKGVSGAGNFVAIHLVIAASVSAINSWRKQRLLEGQKGLDTIKNLNWQEFEELVGEAFRRQGYFILENPEKGPDGGVDLRLRKDGKKVYVQCKHWKSSKVSVKVVRELFGVMSAKGADEGIVVTYGEFTTEAYRFAEGKPIRLINGRKLSQSIHAVQNNPVPAAQAKKPFVAGVAEKKPAAKTPEMVCPKCGSNMLLRTARRGNNAGRKFWGCSKFPDCRGILNYEENGKARVA